MPDFHARLGGLEQPQGSEQRTLVLGRVALRFEGLGSELAARLDRRWGGFLRGVTRVHPASYTVRVFDAGRAPWLERWQPGELYRLEASGSAERRVVVSYHFALTHELPGVWHLGLTAEPTEPADRVLDNVARYLTAHSAVTQGGLAMHAAAVERAGRAAVFAGPSRAGKSTAAQLVRGGQSLGDDFAVVLPTDSGWVAPALPFDNSEGVAGRPQGGEFPVAGIWRLQQAASDRVELLAPPLAVAALVACAAFPWAMPELAETLVGNASRFVETGAFGRLHFTRDADLAALLGLKGPV